MDFGIDPRAQNKENKNMKRALLALLLAFGLLLSLSACGDTDSKSEKKSSKATSAKKTASKKESKRPTAKQIVAAGKAAVGPEGMTEEFEYILACTSSAMYESELSDEYVIGLLNARSDEDIEALKNSSSPEDKAYLDSPEFTGIMFACAFKAAIPEEGISGSTRDSEVPDLSTDAETPVTK